MHSFAVFRQRPMAAILLSFLCMLAPRMVHACDTFSNGTLTIAQVVVGRMVYANVAVTLSGLRSVGSATANPSAASTPDIFDPATGLLTIPCVAVAGTTFTNVVVTIDRVLSVGSAFAASEAPSLILNFPLPDAIVGDSYSQNTVFQVIPPSQYTFAIDTLANGVTPSGMTVDMNGRLSGTPFATGATDINGRQIPRTYTFGVCAIDTLSRWTTSPCPQTSITVRPVNITASIVGNGTVSSPGGNSCGANCYSGFAKGALVTLTATPASGWTFAGWSGACSGTGSCVLSASGSMAVTATFTEAAPPVCTYTYSAWSACSAGQQTRTVLSVQPPSGVCTGAPVTTQACTTSNNACYYCVFDFYCSAFGYGGCWRCRTSTVVNNICQGPSTSLLYYGSSCQADPGLYQICE
jgi:List-Bact-rpt repeat protein